MMDEIFFVSMFITEDGIYQAIPEENFEADVPLNCGEDESDILAGDETQENQCHL